MEEIVAHYQERYREAARLQSAEGQLEFSRTCEVLRRHLPPPPASILDIGGGPGVYSAFLGGLGYETRLIDAVPLHVEQARARPAIRAASLGDARALPENGASADAVLLLGPLYHLTAREDRLRALAEARRVLRPGGVLFAAAISRYASLLDSLARGFIDDPAFVHIVDRDLATGQHRNETGNPDYFTTSYFHRPAELGAELAEAGFGSIELLAVEGVAWIAPDFEARWQDPPRRERLLSLLRATEREPDLLGVSPHLLAVCRSGSAPGELA